MIRKLKTNWLSIALAVVVIVSLVLSGIIWTNPFQYERPRKEVLSNQAQQMTTQSMGDLYLPTTVVKTNKNNKQEMLYSQKENLVLQLQKTIKHWQLGHASVVKTNNSDVYLGYLRQANSITLTYPDEVAGSTFNQTFSQSIDSDRVKQVNHIVIPLNGRHEIYLLSDHHYGVYRVRISKGDVTKLWKVGKQAQRVPVDHKIVNGQAVMVYLRSFSLPVLSYQVNRQKIDNLSTNLLGTSRRTNIATHHYDNKTTYTDGTNRRLVYHQQNGTINYENDISKDNVDSTSQLPSHFYNVLVKAGMPLDNIRYDGESSHGRVLTYRTYAGGSPIINENGYGGAKMQATTGGIERYWMSLYTIQVPLPTEEQNVKLAATSTVLNELHANSHFKDLHGIRVGYLWKTSNSQVVKLVPTYFVRYRGNWVDYTEFIK